MSANRLDRETSPYLLQHKENPVHWLPWSGEAFALARRLNRPILLSVGYAACHWCHVMAHESFEDPATAALMNDLFVNVKVDREERPDLDQIYQAALASLGQHGGWPLTMFLMPDGRPFWGGTYFPPRPSYGRPAFSQVLQNVAEAYGQTPDRAARNAEALQDALGRLSNNEPGDGVTPERLDEIAERLLHEVDPHYGGVNGAPKFPQAPLFELLWRAWLRTGNVDCRTAVVNTLTHMCQGGVYDHLGGGFARYSTDEYWLAPHFEKMLYDNAALLKLLTMTWRETRSPLFEARIRETVGWLLREMVAEGGAFAATVDADSEGEEGRFYVWSEAEIDAALGADAPTFKAAYDVRAQGNWEGVNILNRLGRLEPGDAASESALARMRAVLLETRARRTPPGWDDKVLADWNGLAITALAGAAATFGEPEWLAAAERAFRFVRDRMTKDGRLHHVYRAGTLKHPASVDDLAAMAQAALALRQATGDPAYVDDALAWLKTLDEKHWDNQNGGFFFSADDADGADGAPVICRIKTADESATPSGNGMLVDVFARLYAATGREQHRRRAEEIVAAFSGRIHRNFFPLQTLLNAAETLQSTTLVVVVAADRSAGETLSRQAYAHSLPDLVLIRIDETDDFPVDHPAHGKKTVGGAPTAYVCRGRTCSAPVVDPAALSALLREGKPA